MKDCSTCRHLHGEDCRRKLPMTNSRTGEAFWPRAVTERSDTLRYHHTPDHCGPAGVYWEPRT